MESECACNHNLCPICIRRWAAAMSRLDPKTMTLITPRSSAALDPEHCYACGAFVERNAPPKPSVEVKNELWEAAKLKMRQLEREISACSATQTEKSNMLHTHSKLWMFATDAWEQEVVRPAQRSNEAKASGADRGTCPCIRDEGPLETVIDMVEACANHGYSVGHRAAMRLVHEIRHCTDYGTKSRQDDVPPPSEVKGPGQCEAPGCSELRVICMTFCEQHANEEKPRR